MSRRVKGAEDRDSAWAVFGAMAAVVVMLMVLGWFLVWSLVPSGEWSTFGDVYGAVVGTLFAGFAFAGLILTVHLQRRELAETREELKRTADAQVEAHRALAAQAETMKLAAEANALAALLGSTDKEVEYQGKTFVSTLSALEVADVRMRVKRILKELGTADEVER